MYEKEVQQVYKQVAELQKMNKDTNQLLEQYKEQNTEFKETKKRLQELENSSSINWLPIIAAFLLGLFLAYVILVNLLF